MVLPHSQHEGADSSRIEIISKLQFKMEKQEAKSKWDELVRQLGAQVSPETEQLVETGPPPPADPVSSLVRTSSEADELQSPAPKRVAAGWDNLADEFGLPVPEPPASVVDENVSVTKPAVESRLVEDDRPRRDRAGPDRQERYDKRRESSGRGRKEGARGRDSTERARESSGRGRESSERRRGQSEGRRESHGRRGERSHKRHDSHDSRDRRDIAESSEERAEAQALERDAPSPVEHERLEQKPARVEPPSVLGPAVSLWHKIFGSPADQGAKIEEISSRHEGQQVTSDARVEQSTTHEVIIERERAVDDLAEMPATDEFERPLEPGFEGEQPEQNERRPRRPRRRRRGRGGKGESTSDPGPRAVRRPHRTDGIEARDEIDPGVDDEVESALDVPTDDEDGIADSDDSTDDGVARSARSRAALQRSIPSWEEAIGFIVDVNMQSRSQRRQSGQSSSPRGRPRGRRKN
jgi:hypothetical protein